MVFFFTLFSKLGGIDIVSISKGLLSEFRTVLILWYCCYFISCISGIGLASVSYGFSVSFGTVLTRLYFSLLTLYLVCEWASILCLLLRVFYQSLEQF